ncbi:MAG: hypothetical protein ABJC10_04355 [Acidobacteriota bacterium]
MADGSGGGDIIIKGGSVEVSFDTGMYTKNSTRDPTLHRHDTRKITRVQVKDESGKSQYDSGPNDEGLKWKITISTSDK